MQDRRERSLISEHEDAHNYMTWVESKFSSARIYIIESLRTSGRIIRAATVQQVERQAAVSSPCMYVCMYVCLCVSVCVIKFLIKSA